MIVALLLLTLLYWSEWAGVSACCLSIIVCTSGVGVSRHHQSPCCCVLPTKRRSVSPQTTTRVSGPYYFHPHSVPSRCLSLSARQKRRHPCMPFPQLAASLGTCSDLTTLVGIALLTPPPSPPPPASSAPFTSTQIRGRPSPRRPYVIVLRGPRTPSSLGALAAVNTSAMGIGQDYDYDPAPPPPPRRVSLVMPAYSTTTRRRA